MNNVNKNLFELFGLEKLPPEKGAGIVLRLGKLVFQAVLVRVLPLLSEEDLTEYETITENTIDMEEILKFLSEKIPDFDNIVKEESENLRDAMADEMAQI
jgi:hypothetical protein